jgi:RNA polymerase sigma factor (sigma-70 family)
VRLRVRDAGADDVVQDVMLRLCRELRAGKRYSVPFRVVVYKVTGWLINEHFERRDTTLPLPEDLPDLEEMEVDDPAGLEPLLAQLPPGERAAAELRYLEGLEIETIAAKLGMTRNAVDQALYRARKRLRELLSDG